MRRFPGSFEVVVFLALSGMSLAGTPGSARPGEKASADMVVAADAFLNSLDEAQAKRARLAFDDDERENWHYVPGERAGLPLGDLKPYQRPLAFGLLASGLSHRGMVKASAIMSLEQILAEAEKDPQRRNPEAYTLAVFGSPDAGKPWGWRVEGHHLSVNFTMLPGSEIHAAPSFFGSNPAEVRVGPRRGLRILAAEEDLARALARDLNASGKSGVVFSDRAPDEILTGAKRQAEQLELVGIAASDMDATRQAVLRKLIAEYTGRNRSEAAEADWKKIESAGFGKIQFGWAGSTEPGKAFYYRVQGPTFLLECANTQNNANHIHTVWRDFTDDFARDALGRHFQNSPHGPDGP